MPLVPLAWAAAAGVTAYAVDSLGDTAEQTGNAALKVGAGASLGLLAYWFVYKRGR